MSDSTSRMAEGSIEGLIAYHGTAAAFERFSLEMAASYSSAPLSHLGIYFTPDRELARSFCRKKWSERRSPFRAGARIIAATLTITQPYYMEAFEWIALSSRVGDVVACRELLMLRGFDGVVINAMDNDPTDELHVPQYVIFDPSQATIVSSESVTREKAIEVPAKAGASIKAVLLAH